MTILEILEAHTRSIRNGRCSCEEYGRKRTFAEHHEHVAEVLEQHMQEREAEAWDEGADAEFGRSVLGYRTQANPYT